MSYDYYCTGCGEKLNNDKVLFDMQKLLTRDDRKFKILKFRISQAELLGLYGKEDGEWHHCVLSLADIMGYMANQNNLNKLEVAELSKEDIDNFVSNQSQTVNTINAPHIRGTGFGVTNNTEGEDTAEEQIADPNRDSYSIAIKALLSKDNNTVYTSLNTKRILLDDLKILQTLIHGRTDEEQKLEFDFRINYEKDDKGENVITGVTANIDDQIVTMENNRVCPRPRCGRQIFSKAGTAMHKSVVFLGYQSSGKTSAILSMTHYAINHMGGDYGDIIWANSEVPDSIDEVTPVDKCSTLNNDLNDFSEGYAPPKTQMGHHDTNAVKRGDAYTSTLFIKSHAGAKKVERLITLTDLPGDLCYPDGTIDTDILQNEYKVASACDALVVCLDTSIVEQVDDSHEVCTEAERNRKQNMTPSILVGNTCSWADSFQKMLQNVRGYVPTMLLFTKCRQLESVEQEAPITGNNIPLKRAYMFCGEQKKIENNRIYKNATDKFNSYASLPSAYQAMLRCSPYGYNAPTREYARNNSVEVHKPTPHNIDRLLKWILCVSGCVPVPAKYSVTPANTYILNDYYINRLQIRSELPQGNNGKDWEEAMARVYLFNNPGQFDEAFVKASGQKAVLIKTRFEAKIAGTKKNANLNKE